MPSTANEWHNAAIAKVGHFHADSSNHRPETTARMLWSKDGIAVRFDVQDRYVRARQTQYQDRVSRDSCVEVFLQPGEKSGYFNFEVNCAGTMLLYYIEDASRPRPATGRLFRKYTEVPERLGRLVKIRSSLPKTIEPEIQTATAWNLSMFIPWTLFAEYVGDVSPATNPTWRGNFFKCGDETSQPHWASWNPIGPILRFHQPSRFGIIEFEQKPE